MLKLSRVITHCAAGFLLALSFAPSAGAQRTTGQAASEQQEGEAASSEALTAEQRRERFRRLRLGNVAEVEFAGEKVSIQWGNLPTDGPDFAALGEAKAGDIIRFTMAKAIKLRTEPSIMFGDVLVKTKNFSPDYPGVYGLWLRKDSGGWALVITENPDVWGTQHEVEDDVAEIPLAYKTRSEATENMEIKAVKQDSGASITIAWGTHEWSTAFSVAD